MSRVAAVILAGGRAERLGGINKALLELGGRRLIDRAMDIATGCEPILIAAGRTSFQMPGTVSIPDLESDYAGPLAGVAAAVEALRDYNAALLFSLAVDTPFFPADFLARALPLLDTAPAILAAFGPQDYPTNALWRLEALRALPAGVRDGTAPRSLKRLAQGLGAVRLDYEGIATDDPFRNVNTPEDLAQLNAKVLE